MNYEIQILPQIENSVVILTVDFGDIPKGKHEEKLTEFKETFKEEIYKLKVGGREVIIMPKTVQVSSLPVNEDDVMVVKVDCGTLPPNKAKEYINSVSEAMKTVFHDNKVVVTGYRNERDSLDITSTKED